MRFRGRGTDRLSSPRPRGRVRAGRIGAALLACAAIGMSPPFASEGLAQERIEEFRRVGADVQGPPDATRIRTTPEGVSETLPADEGLEVSAGDLLTVRYPWIMRVRLNVDPAEDALVAIAQDARGEDGTPVAGLEAGRDGARLALHRNIYAGTLVEILNGAMFLEGWPSEREFCLSAAGACAVNQGTSYALRVRDDGTAELAVTADTVEIRWWGARGVLRSDAAGELDRDSLGLAAAALEVEATPEDLEDAGLTVEIATVGEIWEWSVEEPPRVRMAPDTLALAEVVKFNADDVWRGSDKKWLLLIPPAAVAACIIFDLPPFCDEGPVTGNVIVNP